MRQDYPSVLGSSAAVSMGTASDKVHYQERVITALSIVDVLCEEMHVVRMDIDHKACKSELMYVAAS